MTINIYQVGDVSGHPLPEGLQHLAGGSASEWGAYAIVRQFFLDHALDDDGLYGFFAPDFTEKTGLNPAQVMAFVQAEPGKDVYTFSPFVQQSGCFLNVFEEAEFQHEGVMSTAHQYLAVLGLHLPLDAWVTSLEHMVSIGYVVAKPVFWRTWFDLSEKLRELAEAQGNPLFDGLNAQTSDGTFVKTLLVERLASLVLGLDAQLSTMAFKWQDMPAIQSLSPECLESMFFLDGSRQQYLKTENPIALGNFYQRRNVLLTQILLDEGGAQYVRRKLPGKHHADHPIQADQHAVAKPVTQIRNSGWDDPGLFYACLSHVPLPVPLPEQVTTFYMGSAEAEGAYNTAAYAPDWAGHNQTIAGMEGLFAIRNYLLAHRKDVTRIAVGSYRKFVSVRRISGVPAEDNWMMDVVTAADRQKQSLESMMDPLRVPFLVGKPCGFEVGGKPAGYLEHYASAHHAEDLLKVTAFAVELGVFDQADAIAFLAEKEFYIGGIELGIFPAGFWLEAVGQIEQILRKCVQLYPAVREGYQMRSWAFCAERLSSYMIVKYLRTHYREPGMCHGQLNLIVEGNETKYTYGGITGNA